MTETVSKTNGVPAAVPVIVAGGADRKFTLDEAALEKILLDNRVRDSNVVVLSVVGAFRTGKSFLLDFLLRYLYSTRGSDSDGWMGKSDAPLTGFPWKGGCHRLTSGILMWSDPFEISLPSGERVCVLLMDTAGTFDKESTVSDNQTIFALSTILSSMQIYNVSQKIHEHELQYLHLFTASGQIALEKNHSTKLFQDLHFVIRDWQCPYQYEYGADGGRLYIEEALEMVDVQPEELRQVRRHLRACFSNIGCFLIPHPGRKVATTLEFDGRLSDIEDEFKEHVKNFVSDLLSPANLVLKETNGCKLTGKELLENFKAYFLSFDGGEIPKPMSIFETTANVNNQCALDRAESEYSQAMKMVCGTDKTFLSARRMEEEDARCREMAVELFRSFPKLGDETLREEYLKKLESKIDASFQQFSSDNDAKKTDNTTELISAIVGGVVLAGMIALKYKSLA